MKGKPKNLDQLMGALIIFGALVIGGCASKFAAVEKIANVEITIKLARGSNAITYAPLELKFAEDKLLKAKTAIQNGEFEDAQIIAEKALADAQLAEAKSQSEKAKMLAQEMRESINVLRREVNRQQSAN
jgi:hypothetical protein